MSDPEDKSHLVGLPKEKADFLREIAESGYKQILSDRDKLRTRGDWLFGLLAAILGYLFKEALEHTPALKFQFVFLVIEILLLSGVIVYLARTCILPRKYLVVGGISKDLFSPKYLAQPLPDMIVGYLDGSLREVLDSHQQQNGKFAKSIHNSAFTLVASPIVASILAVVVICLLKKVLTLCP